MDRRTLHPTLFPVARCVEAERNIAAHKLRTGRIKRSASRRKTFQQANKQTPPLKVAALDFLAIGDSRCASRRIFKS
jgi:hypothetical protein